MQSDEAVFHKDRAISVTTRVKLQEVNIMKVLKIAGVSILALGLALGAASPILAASGSASPQASDTSTKVLQGEVVSIDEAGQEFFVIQSGEEEITISVDSETKYFKAPVAKQAVTMTQSRMELRQLEKTEGVEADQKPILRRVRAREQATESALRCQDEGARQQLRNELTETCPLGQEASFEDIAIGNRVVVRTVLGEDNPLAKVVMIIKPTAYKHVTGTITDISPSAKTITIAPADGSDNVILGYSEKTRFTLRGSPRLEEGQSAGAVYDNKMIAKRVSAPIEVTEATD